MPGSNPRMFNNKGNSLYARRAIAEKLASEGDPEKRKNLMISAMLQPHSKEIVTGILDKFKEEFDEFKYQKKLIITAVLELLECSEITANDILNKFVGYHSKNQEYQFNEKDYDIPIKKPEHFL